MLFCSSQAQDKLHEASHLEVNGCSSSGHAEAEGWCINSAITFPKNKEVILSKLGELRKETLQSSVVILSDLKEEQVKLKGCFYTLLLKMESELTWSSSVA